MEDVKLPDLSRVRDTKKRSKALPPQKSATDTSNWDNRQISAPTIGIEREFHLILDGKEDEPTLNPYLLQEAIKAQNKAKKTSK